MYPLQFGCFTLYIPVLRTRECLSRIPDPNFSIPDPGSRIRIEEFKYFHPKKWFLSSRKYDPGCSSWILDPDPYFLPISDPGSPRTRGKTPDPGSGSATLIYSKPYIYLPLVFRSQQTSFSVIIQNLPQNVKSDETFKIRFY